MLYVKLFLNHRTNLFFQSLFLELPLSQSGAPAVTRPRLYHYKNIRFFLARNSKYALRLENEHPQLQPWFSLLS